MQISRKKSGSQGKLKLDKGLSDALRDYARERWPVGTAKLCAREWDLTVTEGRGIVEGTASKTTVEKCIKRAGLLFGIRLLEEVTGECLADIFREIRGNYDSDTQRVGALVGDLLAIPASRGPHAVHASLPDPDRRRSGDRRLAAR